jgi:hypothetical protein
MTYAHSMGFDPEGHQLFQRTHPKPREETYSFVPLLQILSMFLWNIYRIIICKPFGDISKKRNHLRPHYHKRTNNGGMF